MIKYVGNVRMVDSSRYNSTGIQLNNYDNSGQWYIDIQCYGNGTINMIMVGMVEIYTNSTGMELNI